MGILEALVLGLVQGVAEFFPISSSAHLVIVPWLFKPLGWTDPGLTFDVGLHFGTLLAVVAYFRRDWLNIGRDFIGGLARLSPFDGQAKLGWFIILGTVPGAAAGVLFESHAEEAFRDIKLVAAMLIVLGIVLLVAELRANRLRGMERLSLADTITIGVAQAFAIIPGVSRSGSTMSMGLFRGLQRDSAARFSFLLATPIIMGASLKRIPSMFTGGLPADERLPLVVGTSAATIASFVTIAVLLRYLQRHSTLPFIIYRLILGLGLLGVAASRGL